MPRTVATLSLVAALATAPVWADVVSGIETQYFEPSARVQDDLYDPERQVARHHTDSARQPGGPYYILFG